MNQASRSLRSRVLFGALPVVEQVHAADDLPERARTYRRDTITLGWEERLRARARRQSDGGLAFATSLKRGTVLRGGHCLIVDEPCTVVVVHELDEPVLVVEPSSPAEWGLFGYHIGNSHQPIMITDRAIVCADLLGMEQVLEYHGIPFRRETMPFTPVGSLVDHAH
jgi:urease accessory protein